MHRTSRSFFRHPSAASSLQLFPTCTFAPEASPSPPATARSRSVRPSALAQPLPGLVKHVYSREIGPRTPTES